MRRFSFVLCAALLPFASGFSEEEASDPFALESRGLTEEQEAVPAAEEEPLFTLEAEPAKTQEVAFNTLEIGSLQKPAPAKTIEISFAQVFSGSPLIYTALFLMSIFSLGIWLYNFLSIRQTANVNPELVKVLREKFTSNQYDEALGICLQGKDLLSKMVAAAITSRKHGASLMAEAMKTEGKRASASFWQRTALLNDVAIIAPMLGLLGTVLGMFYAFYDLHRSLESISSLFDGLGISVGTTVAGLVVAILALIFQSTAKYRLVRSLAAVENEAKSLSNLMG